MTGLGLLYCFYGLIFAISILGFILIMLVFPVWAIVDCAISKDKSNVSKIFWIIFICLTWILGALIYGLFAASKEPVRMTSIVGLIFAGIIIVGLIGMSNRVSSSLKTEISQSIVRLNTTVDTTALSIEKVNTLKSDLAILSQETGFNFKKVHQISITQELLEYFQLIIEDNKIDAQEYEDWQEKFESRNNSTVEDMKKAIQHKRFQQK